jgi:hypothetical protein
LKDRRQILDTISGRCCLARKVGRISSLCSSAPDILRTTFLASCGNEMRRIPLWILQRAGSKGTSMNIGLHRVRSVLNAFRGFGPVEAGVVTVEWVALAGAVVIGGITVVWIVLNNLQTPANGVGSSLATCETYAATHSGSTSGCR